MLEKTPKTTRLPRNRSKFLPRGDWNESKYPFTVL